MCVCFFFITVFWSRSRKARADKLSSPAVFPGTYLKIILHVSSGLWRAERIELLTVGLSFTVCWALVSLSRLPHQTIKPDLVINAGTAGGFKKHDTAIGNVFVSTRVKNHDRRCVSRQQR